MTDRLDDLRKFAARIVTTQPILEKPATPVHWAIDEIERLRGAVPQWRTDMENAPKDGTVFIALLPGGEGICRCYWADVDQDELTGKVYWWWIDPDDRHEFADGPDDAPIAWLPLPPPPKEPSP